MSEMVERVERVLQEEFAAFYRFSPAQGEHLARAAIEAMREPTDSQYDAVSALDKMWRDSNSTEIYQAMIDGALR